KSANNASTVSAIVTIGGTLFAVVAGILIALWTAKSITEPLNHLMTVTREIGDSGDLDQNIDIHRNDEIGALATTFNNMVAYLKEMASVSMSVAEGDLTVEVVRSPKATSPSKWSRAPSATRSAMRSCACPTACSNLCAPRAIPLGRFPRGRIKWPARLNRA